MVCARLDYVGMNAPTVSVVLKALYGLRTSGLRWHEHFADCLRNEGFSPCKAEPDIWMRLNGDLYEYVATYVDDLCLGMLDPKSFTDTLQKKYNLLLEDIQQLRDPVVVERAEGIRWSLYLYFPKRW
jgi:hypothetical protein